MSYDHSQRSTAGRVVRQWYETEDGRLCVGHPKPGALTVLVEFLDSGAEDALRLSDLEPIRSTP